MSVLLLPPIFQFFDNNGDPLANGFVYTYAAGTTTALATYTDSTGTVAAPNPIQLNSAGRPTSGSGAIWGSGAYKFIVKDANGVQVGDTLDNVISFAGLATSSNAYAQTFSGDGTTTVFTASSDLGTDSKALLVSTASGLQEITQNGSFATDTLWTKGAGWTIGAGVATAAGAISTAISQVPVLTIVAGQAYAVTYTITRSAGGLIPSIGGQNGVERTASGTYREIIIAAASTPIAFTGNAFTGTLDNVSVTVATSQPMSLLASNAYTINGTSITFASAPALGVNNIDVRAPSLLVGAASSSAALAQLYAAQALASATSAAAAASLAKWKPAVNCATTANITLSGEQTIDTVLTSGSRVLVKNQTTVTQNGIYVSAAGAWTRATDADTWTEIQGQAVYTLGGSANINKSWVNTNESGGTIGVTDITWTQLFVSGDMNKSVYDAANIAQQLVGTTAVQTLSNKSLVDSTTQIIDNVDATKIAKFDCSAITTGTARTYILPDADTPLGSVMQQVRTQTGAVATGTTVMPYDDTIPQNTEGDEYMTLSITPLSATSKLVIEVEAILGISTGNRICLAIFQDSTANALAATNSASTTAPGASTTLKHSMTSGTTSATTIKFRAGPSGAATVTFNGNAGSRVFGGVAASSITITEYAA